MARVSYTEINRNIDEMVRAIIANQLIEHEGSGHGGIAYAAATGMLIALLADAVSACPARTQREFVERIQDRARQYEQDSIMKRLKSES